MAKATLKDLKKGDKVFMKGFTGMKLGEYEVIAANAKAIKVAKKDGTQMTFDKATGKQTDAKNEKYANTVSVDPADAPEPKEAKKPAPKAKEAKEEKKEKKAAKEEKKAEKPAKGKSKKQAEPEPEEVEEDEDDFEDEDFEEELDDEDFEDEE